MHAKLFTRRGAIRADGLPQGEKAEDAIWWVIVTMATVGYGDKFPITTEGRFIGAIVMIVGIGLFGTFSGFIASWISGNNPNTPASETQKSENDK